MSDRMDAKEALKRIEKLPENDRDRIYAEYWLDKQVKSVLAIDDPSDIMAIMLNFGIALRPNVMRTKWYAQKFGAVGTIKWNMYKGTIAESNYPLRAVQVSALLAVEALGL